MKTQTLDQIDRALLNRLQDGFPVCAHPFAEVAKELGLQEADLIARLKCLKQDRIITRFGPFYDAAAMGGAFCLCAMQVPLDDFDRVAAKVNAHAEVAHNYERAHKLNMWFVLATETKGAIREVADLIEAETGLKVLLFPKEHEFFIGFRVAA